MSDGDKETLPHELDGEHAGEGASFEELREVPRDNYRIGEEIARGGMGVIRDAWDRRSGRRLAIKEVRADVMSREGAAVRAAVHRFRREAILTAQLQHPAIVPVYEIGRFGSTPFIAMKQVSGRALDQVLQESEDSADRLALLPNLIAVAEAIAYAHSEGVVHRDIKPSNIIVGDFGETIVIDWGLAKKTDDVDVPASTIEVAGDLETVAGAVFGTPQYMAPEQAAGKPVGPRGDVYAIGAMLYELLTGEAPYSRDLDDKETRSSAEEIIALVVDKKPRAIESLAPQSPQDLISIANKAMARDASARYESARELATDLRAFERGQLVAVHDYSTMELLRRWMSRHRAVVLTALVLLALGAGSTSWFVLQTMAARDDAQEQERRASGELLRAMHVIRDRGFEELRRGNTQRAAVSLASAYHHLDDSSLRVALAETMRGIDPFKRRVLYEAGGVPMLSVDFNNGRLAFDVGQRTRVVDVRGATLFEVDGTGARFSMNGERIVTRDGGVFRFWGEDGAPRGALEEARVGAWTVAPGGATGVALARDRIVAFSTRTGKLLFETEPNRSEPRLGELVISHDGRRALITRPTTRLINLETRGVISDLDGREELTPLGFGGAISATGGLSAFSTAPGTIEVVVSDAPTRRRTLRAHDRTIEHLTFTDDASRILSIDVDGGLCSTHIDSRRTACDLDARVTSLHTRGEQVATGHRDGSVTLWDIQGHRLATRAAHLDGKTFAFLVGDELVTAGSDGSVRVWHTQRPEADRRIDAVDDESLVVAGPLLLRRRSAGVTVEALDGSRAPVNVSGVRGSVSASRDGSTLIVGKQLIGSDGARIASEPLSSALTAALSADGSLLATCQPDGRIDVVSLEGPKRWSAELGDARDQSPPFYALQFSESGRRLIVSTYGRVYVFDADSGERVATLEHGEAGAEGLAQVHAIRDDTRFVTQDDHRLILWSDSGTPLHTATVQTRPVLTRAPDGQRVVVGLATGIGFFGGRDEAAIHWLGRGQMTEGRIIAIAASPENMIAAGTFHGRIVVYDGDGKPLATRRAKDIRKLSFVGHRLIADTAKATHVWVLAPEKRLPTEVSARIEEVMGGALTTKAEPADEPTSPR